MHTLPPVHSLFSLPHRSRKAGREGAARPPAASVWELLDRLPPGRVLGCALLLYGALNALAVFGIFQYEYDAVEYLDIARNLAQGKGFLSTFRVYYWGPDGFPQPPHLVRPVLFSLLGGLSYSLVPDPRSLQALNLLLGAASLALLHLLFLRRFGRPVAALSVLLLAVSRRFGYDTTFPLSESVALFTLLGALATADHRGPAHFRAFVVGLWVGVAYLARPATLPLLAIVSGYAVLWDRGRRRTGRQLLPAAASLLAGGGLAVSPLWLLNLRHGLPLLYSPSSFGYTTLWYVNFMWDGFGFEPEGTLEVLRSQPLAVLKRIAWNTVDNARGLLLDPQRLGFLLLAWPAVWSWFRRRGGERRFAALLLLLAGTNVVFYSLSWGSSDPERYVFLSFVLALAPAVAGLRLAARRLEPVSPRAFWVAGLILLGAFAESAAQRNLDILRALQEGKTRTPWDPSSEDGSPANAAADWLEARLAPDAPIAASNPWIFLYRLGRPTALLPRNFTPQEFVRFARAYGIRAVVNLEGEETGASREALEAGIRRAGGSVAAVRFGRNAVYLLEPGGQRLPTSREALQAPLKTRRPSGGARSP